MGNSFFCVNVEKMEEDMSDFSELWKQLFFCIYEKFRKLFFVIVICL